jgi:hypothetical protein
MIKSLQRGYGMTVRILVLVISFIIFGTVAIAFEPGYEIIIPKVDAPPTIDGVLNDDVWQIAPTALVEHINDDAGTPVEAERVATAMAAYDDNMLYVAFRNGEPNPGAIVTVAPGHDQDVWADDEIELFMETANAGTGPYYHIMINAANVTQDSEDGGGIGGDWEPASLNSAVEIGADYWAIELEISFADMGLSSSPDGQTWGWNFNRHIMAGVDLWVGWATTGPSFHTPDRFGQLTFGALAAAVDPSAKLTTSWGNIKHD